MIMISLKLLLVCELVISNETIALSTCTTLLGREPVQTTWGKQNRLERLELPERSCTSILAGSLGTFAQHLC